MTLAQQQSIDSDYRVARLAIALLLLIPIGALAIMVAGWAIVSVLVHSFYEWLLS